jgi:hypothetical protein
MITLSFQGETAEQVSAALADFYKRGLSAQTDSTASPAAEDKFPKHEMDTTPAIKTDKKPKPTKVEKTAEEVKHVLAAVEDVRAALMKLAKSKGDDEVWKLLESFKAKSASTVAEADRAALIAKVAELVG